MHCVHVPFYQVIIIHPLSYSQMDLFKLDDNISLIMCIANKYNE